MKKYVMLCAIGLMLTTASFAQNGKRGENSSVTPEERAEKMATRVAGRLSLDDATKDSLTAIYLQDMQEMKAQRERRKEMMEAQNAEVKALLTPAQYEEYQKLAEDRHGRKGRGRGRGSKDKP